MTRLQRAIDEAELRASALRQLLREVEKHNTTDDNIANLVNASEDVLTQLEARLGEAGRIALRGEHPDGGEVPR